MGMSKTSSNRNTAIDYLNRDIVNVKNEVANLSKIVRDGNGQPSLIQQVITVSNELKHLNEDLREEIKQLKETTHSCKQLSSEKDKLSWQFKTAIFVALISSFTSVILQILSK